MDTNFDPIQAFLDWLGEDRHGRSDQAILVSLLGGGECRPQILWPEHKEWKREMLLHLEFLEGADFNIYRQSFFWTEKCYKGIGPRLLEKGDTVCVLLGCTVPFVLREVENHHILVGPCFVLGLMDGEVMKAVEEGEAVIQEFEIH